MNYAVDTARLEVLGLLAFATLTSITGWLRLDVMACIVIAGIGLCNLLPQEALFTGFASEASISLMASMIMSAGMEKSGIARAISKLMVGLGLKRPIGISLFLMTVSIILSSFMRSIAAVALLLPVITQLSIRLQISKRYFLMPVAFCAILGGTLTMVGSSPLLILNSLLLNKGEAYHLAPFTLFEVTPIGALLCLSGMTYMVLISFMSRQSLEAAQALERLSLESGPYEETYGVRGEIYELSIPQSSPIQGMNVQMLENLLDPNLHVVAVTLGKQLALPPLRNTLIKPLARVALLGPKHLVQAAARSHNLVLKARLEVFVEALHPDTAGLCEIIIPPRSDLIHEKVNELHMKRRHKVQVLALKRDNQIYQGATLAAQELKSGDALAVYSQWENLMDFNKNPDFAVISSIHPKMQARMEKMPYAAFFFFAALSLVLFGGYPLTVALWSGALGMILTGVLTMEEAYAAISWSTLFIVAGLIPLGMVAQNSGTAEWVVGHLALDGFSEPTLLWGFAVVTSLATLFISNVGATIILVPLALDVCERLHYDPKLFALTVALAASNAFMIPTHQANVLITELGHYKVRDFLKIGGGLTVLYWIVTYFGLHWLMR